MISMTLIIQHHVKIGVLKYECTHDMNDNHERNDVKECEILTFSLENMRKIIAEIDLKRNMNLIGVPIFFQNSQYLRV